MCAANYFKIQRRLSSRLATVMFHGTPCISGQSSNTGFQSLGRLVIVFARLLKDSFFSMFEDCFFVKDNFHYLYFAEKYQDRSLLHIYIYIYTGSDGLAFLQGLSSAKLQAIGIQGSSSSINLHSLEIFTSRYFIYNNLTLSSIQP